MVSPEFLFDFGSPNAYLAWKALTAIEARTGVTFRLTPCLLGGVFKATGNQSPMQANAGVPAKMAYEMLEMRRFIARHGLDRFRMNPHFPVNTLAIMRGAVAAERIGVFAPYVAACFAAMWEEGLKMDDGAVIAARLDAAGLAGESILAATQEADVKAALIANTGRAVARGVFGLPAFFVGDDMWFGKDRLREVEEALVAERP